MASIKIEDTGVTNPFAKNYICGECGSALSTLKGLQRHFRKSHIEARLTCPEFGCGETFGAQARYDEHLERVHSIHFMKCPYPRCRSRFRDNDALFSHLSSHYCFVSRKDPDQCPYRRCTRRFPTQDDLDRHLAAHLRLASRKAMAAAGMMIEQFTINENIDNPFDPRSTQHEDGSIEVTNDGTILALEENIDAAETSAVNPLSEPSVPSNAKMAIGYVLESPSSQRFPVPCESEDDDYPELLALDESERPRNAEKDETSYAFGDILDPAEGKITLECIITLLDLKDFVTPDELLDLWVTFLSHGQRVAVLRQLSETSWDQDLEVVVRILRTSGLGALIEAWASFKAISYFLPPGVAATDTAAEIIANTLIHCSRLELLRDRGYQNARNAGLHIPDLLFLPSILPHYGPDTPTVQLLSALEERVKCRKTHPGWLQFTKIMVLQEMSKYLQDLKSVVNAMYATEEGATVLRAEFGIFW